ncbi:hypothetical protein BKA93DRAFT_747691 [Sparassis latifolia]
MGLLALPPEILAEIFLEILAQAEQEEKLYYHGGKTYSWIKVSHVCHHWRSVALECPRFWSRIVPTTCPEWVEELLSRSKKARLSVTVDLSTGHVSGKIDAFKLLIENLSRIQQLRLIASQSSLQNIVEFMTGPAPALQTFILTQTGSHMPDLPKTCYPAFPHHDETRRLQHLEIRGPISSTALILPMFPCSLKHLHLNGGNAYLPSCMSDVLKILETTPLLETLKLERVVSGALETDQVVDLPHLRSIRLVGYYMESACLLNYLSLSQDPNIVLKGLDLNIYTSHVGVVASAIAAKISNSDRLRTLSIGRQHLPLAQVQNLSLLSTDLEMPLQVRWVKTFGKLENVSLLQIGGNLAQHLPLALGIREEDGNVIVFPKLRELQLNDVRIRDYNSPGSSLFLDSFLDSLMQRCDHGVEIRHLKLANCINMDMTEVVLISEIVPSVTWDGIEDFVEDDEEEEEEEEDEEDDEGEDESDGSIAETWLLTPEADSTSKLKSPKHGC